MYEGCVQANSYAQKWKKKKILCPEIRRTREKGYESPWSASRGAQSHLNASKEAGKERFQSKSLLGAVKNHQKSLGMTIWGRKCFREAWQHRQKPNWPFGALQATQRLKTTWKGPTALTLTPQSCFLSFLLLLSFPSRSACSLRLLPHPPLQFWFPHPFN